MSLSDALVCPCGAPAPTPLPAAGTRPTGCAACGAPLVRSGGVGRETVERGLGAGLLAASLCSVGWMFAVRLTGQPLHLLLPVGALLISLATFVGARARGPALQWSAGAAFVTMIALGEVLIYRGALLQRLETLHAGEGAPDAAALAREEHDAMSITDFLHIELTMGLFVGVAGGVVVTVLMLRAPDALVAFRRAPERATTAQAMPQAGCAEPASELPESAPTVPGAPSAVEKEPPPCP